MATTQSVSALRAGFEVDGVYACVRKDRLLTRSGSPYLALELRDRTGVVAARAFRDADALAGRFERGDLVRVSGKVERFRDELVVEVSDVVRASDSGVDPAGFLPVAYRDLDELDGFLEHLGREVFDRGYRTLLDSLLGDAELRAQWRRAPCSRAGHHAYLGGLLEHTVAVATLALEVCQLHPRLRSDLLLTAALVHDLGRTREFTYGAEIGLSEEGRLLGHLALGHQMLAARCSALGLDSERTLALLHCVLCHHGPAAAPGGRFGSRGHRPVPAERAGRRREGCAGAGAVAGRVRGARPGAGLGRSEGRCRSTLEASPRGAHPRPTSEAHIRGPHPRRTSEAHIRGPRPRPTSPHSSSLPAPVGSSVPSGDAIPHSTRQARRVGTFEPP